MNQHKFAFRVGVLVLLIAVMAGVFSVRLHNVQITQAAEQDPTPSGSVTYHTRVTAAPRRNSGPQRQRPRREPRQL